MAGKYSSYGECASTCAQVIAIKRTKGIAAKAAKLANHIRSWRFMERLQHDLATREDRLKELHKQL